MSSKFNFATHLQSPRSPTAARPKSSNLGLAVPRSKPFDSGLTTAAAHSTTANVTVRFKSLDLSLAAARSKSLEFSLALVAHISSSKSLASAYSKLPTFSSTTARYKPSALSLAASVRSKPVKSSTVAVSARSKSVNSLVAIASIPVAIHRN